MFKKVIFLFIVIVFTILLVSCDIGKVEREKPSSKDYKITLNVGEATIERDVFFYNYGDLIDNFPIPIKEDYEFVEWLHNGEKFNKTFFDYESDIILFAVFRKTSFYVTYNLLWNEETFTEKAVDGKVIKPSNPIRANAVFKGWCWDNSLEDQFDFNTVIDQDITLFAKWEYITGVYAGSYHFGVSTNTSKLFLFGSNKNYQRNEPMIENKLDLSHFDGENLVGISGQYALTESGRVFQLGTSSSSYKALGDKTASLIPIEITDLFSGRVVDIKHNTALLDNGKVYVWGENYTGNPAGTAVESSGNLKFPTEVINLEGEFIERIDKIDGLRVAYSKSGRVFIWGLHSIGKLLNNDNSNLIIKYPTDISYLFDAKIVNIASIDGYLYFLLSNGSVTEYTYELKDHTNSFNGEQINHIISGTTGVYLYSNSGSIYFRGSFYNESIERPPFNNGFYNLTGFQELKISTYSNSRSDYIINSERKLIRLSRSLFTDYSDVINYETPVAFIGDGLIQTNMNNYYWLPFINSQNYLPFSKDYFLTPSQIQLELDYDNLHINSKSNYAFSETGSFNFFGGITGKPGITSNSFFEDKGIKSLYEYNNSLFVITSEGLLYSGKYNLEDNFTFANNTLNDEFGLGPIEKVIVMDESLFFVVTTKGEIFEIDLWRKQSKKISLDISGDEIMTISFAKSSWNTTIYLKSGKIYEFDYVSNYDKEIIYPNLVFDYNKEIVKILYGMHSEYMILFADNTVKGYKIVDPMGNEIIQDEIDVLSAYEITDIGVGYGYYIALTSDSKILFWGGNQQLIEIKIEL